MKKRCTVLVIILVLLLANTHLIFGEGYNYNKYIKIGLRSGSNAVSLVNLNADNGMHFGYRMDGSDDFNFLNTFEYNKIILRMDDYFIKSDNLYY